jgi:hypothetical protein
MQHLQIEQMAALSRARYADLLREAEQNRLANLAQAQQPSFWQRWFRRSVEQNADFRPEVAPELG